MKSGGSLRRLPTPRTPPRGSLLWTRRRRCRAFATRSVCWIPGETRTWRCATRSRSPAAITAGSLTASACSRRRSTSPRCAATSSGCSTPCAVSPVPRRKLKTVTGEPEAIDEVIARVTDMARAAPAWSLTSSTRSGSRTGKSWYPTLNAGRAGKVRQGVRGPVVQAALGGGRVRPALLVRARRVRRDRAHDVLQVPRHSRAVHAGNRRDEEHVRPRAA